MTTGTPFEVRVHAHQQSVVDFVREYRNTLPVGPSYAEIASATGYASPSAARKAVLVLVDEGRLAHVPNIARSVHIPDGA